MKIMYIHGLDSKLSPEKRKILERFGDVYEPDLNYYKDKYAIARILDSFPQVQMDVIIGSSMGGFAGYYVADELSRPALLFNPALLYRSVEQEVPGGIATHSRRKHIILGQIDEVVNPGDTLNYLAKNLNPETDLHLHLVPDLGHNIPVPFFEEEISKFLKDLGYNEK